MWPCLVPRTRAHSFSCSSPFWGHEGHQGRGFLWAVGIPKTKPQPHDSTPRPPHAPPSVSAGWLDPFSRDRCFLSLRRWQRWWW